MPTSSAEATLAEIARLLREREQAASQLASIDRRIAALATGRHSSSEARKKRPMSGKSFAQGCGL